MTYVQLRLRTIQVFICAHCVIIVPVVPADQSLTNAPQSGHAITAEATSGQTNRALLDDQACCDQILKADLCLTFHSWTEVSMDGLSGDGRIIQEPTVERVLQTVFNIPSARGTNLLVVTVPNMQFIETGRPLPEEFMRRIEQAAKKKGFRRVLFQSVYHGLRHSVYPDGLPSKEEIENRRRAQDKLLLPAPSTKEL